MTKRDMTAATCCYNAREILSWQIKKKYIYIIYENVHFAADFSRRYYKYKKMIFALTGPLMFLERTQPEEAYSLIFLFLKNVKFFFDSFLNA